MYMFIFFKNKKKENAETVEKIFKIKKFKTMKNARRRCKTLDVWRKLKTFIENDEK